MDYNISIIFIALPFLIVGAFFLYNWIGPYIISYKLTAKRLEIRVFRLIRMRWINYSNIAEIRALNWSASIGIRKTIGIIFGESWANRVFIKSFVLIRSKKSFFHHIIITPKDPEDFVKQVNSFLVNNIL